MSVRDPPNNGFGEKIADSKNRDSRTLWAPSKIHLVPAISNLWTFFNILAMNDFVKLQVALELCKLQPQKSTINQRRPEKRLQKFNNWLVAELGANTQAGILRGVKSSVQEWVGVSRLGVDFLVESTQIG